MRMLIISLVLIVLLVSNSYAELLTTSMPLGKGEFTALIGGVQNQNVNNQSDATLATYGGYIGYGITDRLDTYLQIGSAASAGLKVTHPIFGRLDVNSTANGYGINFKYSLLDEAKNKPVSLAFILGYLSASQKVTAKLGTTTISDKTSGISQILVGLSVSKVISSFIPYGAIGYRQNKSDGTDSSTQVDITIGSAIAWSAQGTVYLEYTSQIKHDETAVGSLGRAGDHNSGQIAAGLCYKI